MASRPISSLVTTLLPRRLISPFSPVPSFFHRSNKINTLSKILPSSPNHLVLHPRPFSTTPLSNDTLTPTPDYIKQAKENLIKKLREEGNPFQIIDDISNDYIIVLQREYGGDMIEIVAYFYGDVKYFEVNVVKKDESRLGLECKWDNLENSLNQEEIEIVSVRVLKAGEHDRGNGKNTQYFKDIDEDLQKGFLDYLDKRGIKNDLVAWLHDYRKVSARYINAVHKYGEPFEEGLDL